MSSPVDSASVTQSALNESTPPSAGQPVLNTPIAQSPVSGAARLRRWCKSGWSWLKSCACMSAKVLRWILLSPWYLFVLIRKVNRTTVPNSYFKYLAFFKEGMGRYIPFVRADDVSPLSFRLARRLGDPFLTSKIVLVMLGFGVVFRALYKYHDTTVMKALVTTTETLSWGHIQGRFAENVVLILAGVCVVGLKYLLVDYRRLAKLAAFESRRKEPSFYGIKAFIQYILRRNPADSWLVKKIDALHRAEFQSIVFISTGSQASLEARLMQPSSGMGILDGLEDEEKKAVNKVARNLIINYLVPVSEATELAVRLILCESGDSALVNALLTSRAVPAHWTSYYKFAPELMVAM